MNDYSPADLATVRVRPIRELSSPGVEGTAAGAEWLIVRVADVVYIRLRPTFLVRPSAALTALEDVLCPADRLPLKFALCIDASEVVPTRQQAVLFARVEAEIVRRRWLSRARVSRIALVAASDWRRPFLVGLLLSARNSVESRRGRVSDASAQDSTVPSYDIRLFNDLEDVGSYLDADGSLERIRAVAEGTPALQLAHRVRLTLTHEPSLRSADVARVVGMSVRTLQRHLNASQTSFTEIRDLVRRQLAEASIRRGFKLRRVATDVGFRSPTAFHRWYKRHFGATPLDARLGSSVSMVADDC